MITSVNAPDKSDRPQEINCVRVEIRAEMREVTADYDLPVRIQRKAGWENDSV